MKLVDSLEHLDVGLRLKSQSISVVLKSSGNAPLNSYLALGESQVIGYNIAIDPFVCLGNR